MAKKHYLPHYQNYNCGGWICFCGNTEERYGFYTCDAKGNELEPVNKNWDELYACSRCGRIIKQTAPEIVGQRRQSMTEVAKQIAKDGF